MHTPTSRTVRWTVSGLLSLLVSGPLHAGVGASAFVDIDNLTITGANLSLATPVTTGDVKSDLTGQPSDNAGGTSNTDVLDLRVVCTGDCPQVGANTFPVISGAPTATFATADQVRSGTLTAGAHIGNGVYTGVAVGESSGSADSNTNLNGQFTVGTAGALTLSFDARAYMESFVSAGEVFPGFSTAAYQVTFSIVNLSDNGRTVFTWSPDGSLASGIFGGSEVSDPYTLNTTISLNAPLPGDTLNSGIHAAGQASTGIFRAQTDTLQPGQLYQLSVRVIANADAQRALTSRLGDRLWNDQNGNGIQDCADTNGNGIVGDAGDTGEECKAGVPGATVNLRTPDVGGNCTGAVIATTPTDANGFYQFGTFNALPGGTYCVEFMPPADYCGKNANFAFTAPNVGVDDAKDSDARPDGTTGPVTLADGEINRTVDAGIYCPASLGDFVWNDSNQNGVQDVGEPGIGNVTVKLYACGGSELAVTATDGNGVYGFHDLKPGSYYVTFTAPNGYVFTLQNQGGDDAKDSNAQANGQTGCLTLASGENNDTVDGGLYRPAEAQIGDFVWHDLDKDGVQDANEPGIAGASVTLFACGSSSPLADTTTDSNGNYLFANLMAGSYYVRFDRPAGYAHSSPIDQGIDDALDSDVDPNTGDTACVDLADGEINRTVDAGFSKPVSLGDFVWNDVNQNGIQDVGEPGIAGVEVKLYGCDGSELAATTTDGEGVYGFHDLMPGSYYVGFKAPNGYVFASQNQGADDGRDSDADSNGLTSCVTLQSGENNLTVDAGLYLPALSRLGDFAWHDLNADGIQDQGEPGIPGVKVALFACGSTDALATKTTDVNGIYLFENLPAGSYYVRFEQPSGYSFASPQDQGANDAADSDASPTTGETSCVVLGHDETNLTVDAGFHQSAALGDLVWNDLNANGIQDAGEGGIAGVAVDLYDCNGDVLQGTTTTDGDGLYGFTSLMPGNYYVRFDKSTTPAGFVFSPRDQGANDAVDSDADSTTGKTACVALVSGETDLTVDAGLHQEIISGGEGCTPGYWKQHQHFDSWTPPYTPTTLFSAVFENAFPGKSLRDVLALGGGGLNALGRHTVAALLNAASPNVNYDRSVGDVINAFNAVYPGSDAAYEALKDQLETFNEQGCPLN